MLIYVISVMILISGFFWKHKEDLVKIPPQDSYFTETNIEATNAYQLYLKQYKDEQAKVFYLINLVRESPLTFIRNNKRYNGSTAAQWLEFKVDRYRNEIKTVNDFIEKVGSFSRKTGKAYYVLTPDRKKYAIKYIFYNELSRLDAYEKQNVKREQKTMPTDSQAVNI
jgi:hypothetical protein